MHHVIGVKGLVGFLSIFGVLFFLLFFWELIILIKREVRKWRDKIRSL